MDRDENRRTNIRRWAKKRREIKAGEEYQGETQYPIDYEDKMRNIGVTERAIEQIFKRQTLEEKREWLAWSYNRDAAMGAKLAQQEADEVELDASNLRAEEARLIAAERHLAEATVGGWRQVVAMREWREKEAEAEEERREAQTRCLWEAFLREVRSPGPTVAQED